MKLTGTHIVLILAAVVLLLIGAALGGMYTKIQVLEEATAATSSETAQNSGNPPAGGPIAPPSPTTVSPKVTADDPIQGNPNAKLTVVEFGDYQCPFCKRFFTDVEPQLKQNYIDTGKVKFVFKNLAFLGKESTGAANAALCAKEQNKFWEYHDKLYGSQQGENQGAFSIDKLKMFAGDLGLNVNQFNRCLDSQKYNPQVQVDNAEAARLGFNSTPSTAIGTVPIVGAQPWTSFQTVIDQELAKAK